MKKSTSQSITGTLVVCSYCSKLLTGPTTNSDNMNNQVEQPPPQISHGICPDCLLEKHPKEYLEIQRNQRLRIKHAFRHNLPIFKIKYL